MLVAVATFFVLHALSRKRATGLTSDTEVPDHVELPAAPIDEVSIGTGFDTAAGVTIERATINTEDASGVTSIGKDIKAGEDIVIKDAKIDTTGKQPSA